jgi:hypothetical protein
MRTGPALLLVGLHLLLLFPSPSDARFIRILSDAQLEARAEAESVTLFGTYELENQGDETARDVFLAFELGTWAFTTEKRSLSPGVKHSGQINESFPLARLRCGTGDADLCAEQELPLKGAFPLRIMRHYQDGNGYPFSAVAVQPLKIGQLTEEQQYTTGVVGLRPVVVMKGTSGEAFSGTVEVRNLRDAPQTVSVALVLPSEFINMTEPFQLQIPPRGTASGPFQFGNDAGLTGSAYEVVTVLQWAEGGVRHTSSARQMVTVQKSSRAPYFIGVLVVALGVWLLVRWMRRRRVLVPAKRRV